MRKRQALANGPAIATFRAAKGLSQPGLADRTRLLSGAGQGAPAADGLVVVKVSEATIAMIEAGRRQPSANVLHTLALALDVPVESIGRITGSDHARCPHCDGTGVALVGASA